MLRFIVRRLIQTIFILFALSLFVFIWLRALPGDTVSALLGERGTAEDRAQLAESLGLNDNYFVQYWRFLSKVLFQGDFGVSSGVEPGRSAMSIFLERFPATVELSLFAMLLAVAIGIPMGYLAARRKGTWMDNTMVMLSLIGVAVPVFFLAYMLQQWFALNLDWFPLSDRREVDGTHVTGLYVLDGILTREFDAAWDALKHLILPAVALATIPFAVIFRITRASVLEVLDEDYVRTAESKGLMPRTIRGRHVLRNSLIPVITAIGLLLGSLFSGALLTESVFNIRGIGLTMRESYQLNDYSMLQVLILMSALGYVVINLIVDIAYAIIDPRVRTR